MILPGVIASSGGVPSSFESIATYTGSGNPTSVTFSSLGTGFTHLQLRMILRTNTATQDYLIVKYNSTAVSYRHILYGDGAGAFAIAGTGGDLGTLPSSTYTSGIYAASILDILDYANTNKTKVTRGYCALDINGTGGNFNFASSLYNSTTAISSITVATYSGTAFATNSHFALYGVKA